MSDVETTAPEGATETPKASTEAPSTVLGADKPTDAVGQPPVEQAASEAADKGTDKPTDGAPEAYEAFTMPEGVEVNQAAIDAFAPLAKELNLSQGDAQKFVDLHNDLMQKAVNGMWDAHVQQRNEWAETAGKDEEYGGAKFDDSIGIAKAALDRFGTPELKKALEESGLGSHPEVVRLFYRLGKTTADDSVVLPDASGGQRTAQTLYPNSDMR